MRLMIIGFLAAMLAFGCKDEEAERAKAKAEAEAAQAKAEVAKLKAAADAAAAQAKVDGDKAKAEMERFVLEAQVAKRVRDEMEAAAAAKEAKDAEEKADMKQDIASHPDKYLVATGLQYHDKGIINSYRQLVAVTVENKSPNRVKAVQGSVEWQDSNGNMLGASPIVLDGTIEPGDSLAFSVAAGTLASGTIQGAASGAKVRFSRAKVLD